MTDHETYKLTATLEVPKGRKTRIEALLRHGIANTIGLFGGKVSKVEMKKGKK